MIHMNFRLFVNQHHCISKTMYAMNFSKCIHKWPLSQAIPSLLRILPALHLTRVQVRWLPFYGHALPSRLDVRNEVYGDVQPADVVVTLSPRPARALSIC